MTETYGNNEVCDDGKLDKYRHSKEYIASVFAAEN